MRRLRLALCAGGIALPLLALVPAARATDGGPCSFGRGTPIPDGSTWSTQLKCYQTSGRHVSIVGSGSFEAGTVSGGVCLTGVSADRFQVAACGSFGGDGAMTVATASIAYLIDDPRSEVVNIYLTPLFHR